MSFRKPSIQRLADFPSTDQVGAIRMVRELAADYQMTLSADGMRKELAKVISVAVGTEGPQGPQGNTGETGSPGPQGDDGNAGVDGADGSTGAAGADGADGADGDDGAPGADGADGPNAVSAATSTTFTGFLKGTGAVVNEVVPGTGVETAFGVNIGSPGAFILNGGALGTPASGVATNLTGTASGLTAGTVTTNANLTGPVTSTGNATAIANGAISNAMLANAAVANLSGTNTGDNATNSQYSGLVSNATHTGDVTGSTSLTLVNIPALSGANLTTLNASNISTGTLAAARGGTGVSNTGTITLAGNLVTTGAFNTTFAQAATTTVTLPATSATMARTDAAQTLAGTQTFSGAIHVAAGSTGALAIANSAATTTGFYFGSNFVVFQSLGTPKFFFQSTSGFALSSDEKFGWASTTSAVGALADTILTREAAATIQMGLDAASPVAQTFKACDARAGTDTNTAGTFLTLASGRGTGTAATTATVINLQTPEAVASGTGAQTLTTRLQVTGLANISSVPVRLPGSTVAGLPATPTQGDTAFVTDALAPAFLTAVVGGGAVVTTVFYNGTNWIAQ